MVVPEADYEGGGYCGNSTAYCNFGCCGAAGSQACCFPVGIYIGCGLGIIGAVCLLVTIFRCRMGCVTFQGRAQEAGLGDQQLAHVTVPQHQATTLEVCHLPPSYGWRNPAFPFPPQPGTEMGMMCHKCLPLHANLPPSYEECMNTGATAQRSVQHVDSCTDVLDSARNVADDSHVRGNMRTRTAGVSAEDSAGLSAQTEVNNKPSHDHVHDIT